jgi:FkbH-like protein
MKYADLLDENKNFRFQNTLGESLSVLVVSNVVVHTFKDVLENILLRNNINPQIIVGEYNNIVQECASHKNPNCVVILWEAGHVFNGSFFRSEGMDESKLDSLRLSLQNEISLIFKSLEDVPLVIFNLFNDLPYRYLDLENDAFSELCTHLNLYAKSIAPKNIKFIDLTKVYADVSIDGSFDWRYFHSSSAPYTMQFLKSYSSILEPYFVSLKGKAKKALILDCDNTLWSGILGEDGFDGIEMSSKTKRGAPFEIIQSQVKELAKKGVIVGICSKNNSEDVDKVLSDHPEMVLTEKYIAIKCVNWDDKVSNLKAIAQSLNIGLDSLVFIDDSDFEANYIRKELPEVTVFQVPRQLSQYPTMFSKWKRLFFNLSQSSEDTQKIQMYKTQLSREQSKAGYKNIEEYLASLKLEVQVYSNDGSTIPRVSQLTQKTNQFNLTTHRYSEIEIQKFVNDSSFEVLAFGVTDTFGDNGITGLVILKIADQEAEIDTFLMSCRILGRKIEDKIIDYVLTQLKAKNLKTVRGKFIKTQKNAQVESLYDRFGFKVIEAQNASKGYSLDLSEYQSKSADYIRMNDGR